MIYAKRLEDKKLLFTVLLTIEYVLIMEVVRYNVWAHVLVISMTYILLKLLYKEKSQITDIFTFGIASLVLILICIPTYLLVWKTIGIYAVFIAFSRLLMLLFIVVFKNKLYNIQKLYKKLWNRNDKEPKKIKSTTFRALNIVIFNFMFYFINLCILFSMVLGR